MSETATTGAMAGKQWRLFAVAREGSGCDDSSSGEGKDGSGSDNGSDCSNGGKSMQ